MSLPLSRNEDPHQLKKMPSRLKKHVSYQAQVDCGNSSYSFRGKGRPQGGNGKRSEKLGGKKSDKKASKKKQPISE